MLVKFPFCLIIHDVCSSMETRKTETGMIAEKIRLALVVFVFGIHGNAKGVGDTGNDLAAKMMLGRIHAGQILLVQNGGIASVLFLPKDQTVVFAGNAGLQRRMPQDRLTPELIRTESGLEALFYRGIFLKIIKQVFHRISGKIHPLGTVIPFPALAQCSLFVDTEKKLKYQTEAMIDFSE